MQRVPSVDEARPTHCVGCRAPGRPVGQRVVLHGQGTVERQIRGVLSIEDEPGITVIRARRYECQECFAVITVLPSGLLAGRSYSAPSIALALFLWIVDGLSSPTVRARVCAWRAGAAGARGWPQLSRWMRAADALFPLSRPPGVGPPRDVARRVLDMLAAVGRGVLDAAGVFVGAAALPSSMAVEPG